MAQSATLSPGGYVRQGQRHASPPRSVNVQVAVRCRPINDRERSHAERPILTCDEDRREVNFNALSASSSSSSNSANQRKIGTSTSSASALNTNKRTFTYDHVFDQHATQADVYNRVVEPIVDEVLQGYNCTVFAYGQTGTGKTHTMEGGRGPDIHNESISRVSEHAGIIPRSIKQIFDHLRSLTDEHSVRVSHLELYNEQLTDLLSPEDAELRVYEDQHKGTFVQGLEDTVVRSEQEIFSVLDKSAAKRKTAETAMNKYSSRSHSIFSITIHIKESTPDGADLLKVGKLNLVDLAGSENIGRSGAVKGRAREAGNINQSLLTLGRVITALVDRHPHVPYRDSKLTRLLQESLGGRNKTCVIATVTPASGSTEETASTLDYAYRAKSIKNRPTVNQMIAKHVLLKEYTDEIAKLKRELDSTREKNGVYLPVDEYEKLQRVSQSQSSTIDELETRTEEYEKKLSSLRGKLDKTQDALERDQRLLATTRANLQSTSEELERTKEDFVTACQQRDENGLLIKQHVTTERTLRMQGNQLQTSLKESLRDVESLHDRVDIKMKLEEDNINTVNSLKVDMSKKVADICSKLEKHRTVHKRATETTTQLVNSTKQGIESTFKSIISHFENLRNDLEEREKKDARVLFEANDALGSNVDETIVSIRNAMQAYIKHRVTHHDQLKEGTQQVVKLLNTDVMKHMDKMLEAVECNSKVLRDSLEAVGDEQKKELTDLETQMSTFAEEQSELIKSLQDAGLKDSHDQLRALHTSKETVLERISSVMDELISEAKVRTKSKTESDKKTTECILSNNADLQKVFTSAKSNISERCDSTIKTCCDENAVELGETLQNVRDETHENIIHAGTEKLTSLENQSKNILEKRTLSELQNQVDRDGIAKLSSAISTRNDQLKTERNTEASGRTECISNAMNQVKSSVQLAENEENEHFTTMLTGIRETDEQVVEVTVDAKQSISDGIGKEVGSLAIACDTEAEMKPSRKERPSIAEVELAKTRNHTSLIFESRTNQVDVRNEVEIEDFGHAVARTPERVEKSKDSDEETQQSEADAEENVEAEAEADADANEIEAIENKPKGDRMSEEESDDEGDENGIVFVATTKTPGKRKMQSPTRSDEEAERIREKRGRERSKSRRQLHRMNGRNGSTIVENTNTPSEVETLSSSESTTSTRTDEEPTANRAAETVLSDVSNRRAARSRSKRRIEPVIKKASGIPAPRSRNARRFQMQQ